MWTRKNGVSAAAWDQRVKSSGEVAGPTGCSGVNCAYPPMSVVKPGAPPTARFSMSGTIEGRPVAGCQSTVSSPGNCASS